MSKNGLVIWYPFLEERELVGAERAVAVGVEEAHELLGVLAAGAEVLHELRQLLHADPPVAVLVEQPECSLNVAGVGCSCGGGRNSGLVAGGWLVAEMLSCNLRRRQHDVLEPFRLQNINYLNIF